ncbi:MAG: hypothetical protein JWN02_671 [Acidobacteria bacterium]|nr:hypothetical protein [Acidobacteriota bacterium]
MDLTVAPAPLTSRQRLIFWIVAAVCALSRLAAMARSLWDWDEALFCLGMRSYDVASHHPHPPGFPVYIALGRLMRLAIHDDFRALQAVNLIAGALVFPAVFLLARELRFRFGTALVAGALCAFFPNVWFFGGGAFSDVPSIVLVVLAVALYFRGVRDANAYLVATFLLALAIGIRPQNLLIGLFPGALATWHRGRAHFRDVLFAAFLGTAIVGLAFGGAVAATGSLERYRSTVKAHSEYIAKVDSFRSPDRTPLWRLFDRFFIKQYQSPALSVIISLFVVISAAGAVRDRDRRIGYLALTFGPFALVAWLMLDRFSISRFSIGYIPMFALLAADGIRRAVRDRADLEPIAGLGMAAAFAFWTLPALTVVRQEISPTVAAMNAMLRTVDPRRDQLFVAFSMAPFMEYYAPYTPWQRVLDERAMPLSVGKRRPVLLTELDHTNPAGPQFRRERGRLWNIARRHYFEVALAPLGPAQLPRFVSGWYAPERAGTDEWRWTGRRGVVTLPPAGGKTKLRLHFNLPGELMPLHPHVTITLNGKPVDSFAPADAHVERDYEVDPAPSGVPNTLVLELDRTLNEAREHVGTDGRELGLLLRFLSWGPA